MSQGALAQEKLKLLGVVVFIVALGYVFHLFYQILSLAQQPFGYSGGVDFIEYWSAFQLWSQGLNPYNGQNMLNIQAQVLGYQIPLMMWNPPWLLAMVSPILLLNFQGSVVLWFVFNLLLVLLSVELLVRTFKCSHLRLPLIGMVLLFAPIRSSLQLGQVGTLLLFGSALFLWSKIKRSDLGCGIGLLIFSIKPHLFALVVLAL